MKKNFISLLFVSAITVGLLSACSSAPADNNATNPKAETVTSQANHDTNSSPVSVTLNEVAHSIFYAPQYVAIENGYEYYGAAEPPVRCGESHLSGLTEPPQFVY